MEDGYVGLRYAPLKIESFYYQIGQQNLNFLLVGGNDFRLHCYKFLVDAKDFALSKMEDVTLQMTPDLFNSKIISISHCR